MILLSTLLLAFPAQDAAAQEPAAKPEVAAIQAALRTLGEAENYTFTQTTVQPGNPMGGAGRGERGGRGGRGGAGAGGAGAGGDAAQDPTGGEGAAAPAPVKVVLTGHVQKGLPVHFVQGKEEAWRDSDGNLVYKNAEGGWTAFDRAAMRGGFGGGADRGGRGGRGGAEDGARQQDPAAAAVERNALMARMGLLRAGVAHEIVAGLDEKLATVKKSSKGGKTVYSGELTAEGAAGMGGGGGARAGRGGRGGDSPMTNTGTYVVILGADGAIESMVVDTVMSGTFGDRKIERKRHMELAFSAVGKTELAVPSEVTEALKAAAASTARDRTEEEF